MEIRDFLADLAKICDPVWREQIEGIAENYERYGALTPRQKKSVEVEVHKLKRHMPPEWKDVELRDPMTPPSAPPNLSAEREAIADVFEEFAVAAAKLADRFRQ